MSSPANATHWNIRPAERLDAHGTPTGTFRAVAEREGEGADAGLYDLCEHEHRDGDAAMVCGVAVHNADALTGITAA